MSMTVGLYLTFRSTYKHNYKLKCNFFFLETIPGEPCFIMPHLAEVAVDSQTYIWDFWKLL